MRWSFRIARVAGIDVRIHATFFLLFAWIAFVNWSEKRPVEEGVRWALFIAVMFFIVVLHEFGHALTARAFGIRTKDITLLPIGGIARLERMPEKPWQELLVALAGPAVNVVICGGAVGVLALQGRLGDLMFDERALRTGWLVPLAISNGILAAFNMLPAFPMDGGRVLRALLAMHFDAAFATALAARLGQAVALVFVIFGVAFAPMFALIGLFVWIGAGEENRQMQFRTALAGFQVASAMATEIRTLSPADTLERAALFLTRTTQSEFPVVDGERVVGLLTRRALFEAIGKTGFQSPVSGAMAREFPTVSPADPLDRAFVALQSTPPHAAPVLDGGRLVGLLTLDEVAELAAIQDARREAASRGSA